MVFETKLWYSVGQKVDVIQKNGGLFLDSEAESCLKKQVSDLIQWKLFSPKESIIEFLFICSPILSKLFLETPLKNTINKIL